MKPWSVPDPLERRVFAAMASSATTLEALADVETADFYDPWLSHAFEALRNVQARGEDVSISTIAAYVEQRDAELDKHLADRISYEWLGFVLAGADEYATLEDAIADSRLLRARRLLRDRGELGEPSPAKYLERDGTVIGEDNAFVAMAARVLDERAERAKLAARALHYHVPYLDDLLRVILPHDLVLLGAPPGVGKTDLALSIALRTVLGESDARAAYFALEAEPLELERRIKYSWISQRAWERNLEGKHELNYVDWYVGNCDHIIGSLNDEAERWFDARLGGLLTFYRGEKFGQEDLRRRVEQVHKHVDLIVIDHLHYVDLDADTTEARAVGDLIKSIRDISLRIGKPILLVAHLRKKDERLKKVIPSIYDFHGSSEITKVCTQAITIERAHDIEAPKWWLSPTFMSVLKDRRAGTVPLVALAMFDRRSRTYQDTYTLGRLIKGGTEWEQLKPGEAPSWARCNKQLELEFNA